MSEVKVREVTVDGYSSFIATARLVCGALISITSHSEDAAIEELQEEARYRSSSNPNQGMNFDEDEEDYYC